MKIFVFLFAFFVASQAATHYSSMPQRFVGQAADERVEKASPQEAFPNQRHFRAEERNLASPSRYQDGSRAPIYPENRQNIQVNDAARMPFYSENQPNIQDSTRKPFQTENQPVIQSEFGVDHSHFPFSYSFRPFPLMYTSPYVYHSNYFPVSHGKFYYQVY
ncbi:uncharacterized protein [Centruroides vittatus]|uniref:uncharacterized protein n=1 Tax=Centruroides vittatus TaxID=120091 RepID=UPI00350F0309